MPGIGFFGAFPGLAQLRHLPSLPPAFVAARVVGVVLHLVVALNVAHRPASAHTAGGARAHSAAR